VAIEFGLTRLRQYPESEMDTPGLRRAWEMTDDLEFYLTTCQVWISGTSIALGIVAEPGIAALFAPLVENTTFASAARARCWRSCSSTWPHLTHGEQTPTYLGVERSKQVAQYGARPLYWFAWLISPVIKFGDWVAKATLRLFGVEMTGSWTETEGEVLETRTQLRARLGSMMKEVDLPEERREEVLNALDVDELAAGGADAGRRDRLAVDGGVSRRESRPDPRHPAQSLPARGRRDDRLRGIVYAPRSSPTSRRSGERDDLRRTRRPTDGDFGDDER